MNTTLNHKESGCMQTVTGGDNLFPDFFSPTSPLPTKIIQCAVSSVILLSIHFIKQHYQALKRGERNYGFEIEFLELKHTMWRKLSLFKAYAVY